MDTTNTTTTIIPSSRDQNSFKFIREALKILYRNTNFIILILVSSMLSFCILLPYEFLVQKTLVGLWESMALTPDLFKHNWVMVIRTMLSLFKEFSQRLLQPGLYLFPIHLLHLCIAIAMVDVTSELWVRRELITLKDMVYRPIYREKFRAALITSTCVLFLSTSYVLGSIWLVSNYYVILKNFGDNVLSAATYRAGCIGLLCKYLEWGIIWNMGIVISVLEKVHGANALLSSAYLSRRNARPIRFLLMLASLGWEVGLRHACLFARCHERKSWLLAVVSVLSIGHVIKWMVFTAYYHICRQKIAGSKGNIGV